MNERHPHRGRVAVALAAAIVFALAALPGMAAAKDRNNDGIPDRWERKHHLSLKKNQAKRDQDKDALRNRGEYRAGTDPRDPDTDGDGVKDGDEGAGTIESFDPSTGELVIKVFNNGTISGLVTEKTEIECENDDVEEPDGDNNDGDDGYVDEEEPGEGVGEEPGGEEPGGEEGNEEGYEPDFRAARTGDYEPGYDEPSYEEPGADEPGEQEDEDDCTAADLIPGTVVVEASLDLTADGLVFAEIELR